MEEAKQAAAILGYNYGSSAWYQQSYRVFNKKYRPQIVLQKEDKKELGLVRRVIQGLFK